MQTVGYFISIYANMGRLHLVDRSVEVINVDILQIFREIFLQQRKIMLPERIVPGTANT